MKQIPVTGAIVMALLISFTGCKKKNTAVAEEAQGTAFERLLKTILTSTRSPFPESNEYSYTATGFLSVVTTRSTDAANGQVTLTTETFYRAAGGRIDSIILRAETNGVVKNRIRTYFYYQLSGQLAYSIYINDDGYSSTPVITTDSSRYVYSSNKPVSRSDYRKFGTGTFSYLRTFSYDYDAAGNVSALGAVYTNPAVTDTIRFTYDNKINPLPVLRGIYEMGYWGPAFYDDFHLANNLITRRNRDWDPMDFEYRYSANNKPLYQKIKTPGTTSYSEMKFYYD